MKNNNSDHDERGLLPFPVIVAATKGDPDAMKLVLSHYEGLGLSVRKLRDERGNTYHGVDQDIYDRLRSQLIRAVLYFKFWQSIFGLEKTSCGSWRRKTPPPDGC